ncbi:MAG: hypothetical protein Q9P01_15875, partial [Anaerolineae bacterium]|nr:hypothetical protein [Anaerolineae bacterium]
SFDSERILIPQKIVNIPVTFTEGEAALTLNMTIFYCEEDTFCLVDDVTVIVPVNVTDDAENSGIIIDHTITLPEAFAADL